jgi:hypothetical protein
MSATGLTTASCSRQTIAISRIVNAFFRWEFNSCEMLVKGHDVFPIDYANACPDVSVTSLHYYFPWAMRALVKWTVFCLATGRRADVDLHTRAYFEISDRDDLDYGQKLAEYLKLADAYFAAQHYQEFCAKRNQSDPLLICGVSVLVPGL